MYAASNKALVHNNPSNCVSIQDNWWVWWGKIKVVNFPCAQSYLFQFNKGKFLLIYSWEWKRSSVVEECHVSMLHTYKNRSSKPYYQILGCKCYSCSLQYLLGHSKYYLWYIYLRSNVFSNTMILFLLVIQKF